jgi:hypothetical protein
MHGRTVETDAEGLRQVFGWKRDKIVKDVSENPKNASKMGEAVVWLRMGRRMVKYGRHCDWMMSAHEMG